MSTFIIESRKYKTLSIVKDFQNLLDSFSLPLNTSPLLLHKGEKTRGEGTLSKMAVRSVLSENVLDSSG